MLPHFPLAAPPPSPGGDAPRSAPPEVASPQPQQPPAAPDSPAAVATRTVREGTAMIRPFREMLDEEDLTVPIEELRQTMGSILEEFGIPRESFESQRLLASFENFVNAITRNVRTIRTWMQDHGNPNILVREIDPSTFVATAMNNAERLRTPDDAINFVMDSFFDFSQSGLSQSDINSFKDQMGNVFRPIKDILDEGERIQQRNDIISNMSEPVAKTLWEMQRNPQLTAYFSDTNLPSTMLLNALTPQQREAILAFRVIEQRVPQEQQAVAGAPAEGSTTTTGSTETGRGSTDRHERFSWTKFWKQFAIVMKIIMDKDAKIDELLSALEDIEQGRVPQAQTPPAAARERPAVLATNSLFEGARNLQVRDAPLMNGIIVNSETPFTMKTPLAGKVIRIRNLGNGNKELSLKVEETDTSYNVLKFAFTGATNLTFSPRLGRGIGVEQGFNLATNVTSVGLNMERYRKIRGRQDERTLCAPSTIRDLYSIMATAPATSATGAPVATPAEGSQAAPAPPPAPAANVPREQTEPTLNSPGERRADATRTYEALKTLAEEAKNLQGSDVYRVTINALVNADSGSLEALWRQFPRNPNQQAYETFQGETANLRAKLQAWKEYPELARRAQARGVVLQQAGPESSGDAGNTARQNIVAVVEALKNALQALPQQEASATQAPPARTITQETPGSHDEMPSTSRERRRALEDRMLGIRELKNRIVIRRPDVIRTSIENIFHDLETKFQRLPREITTEVYETFFRESQISQRKLLAWLDLPDLIARVQTSNRPSPAGIENLEASTDAGNQARENIVALVDALRSTINAPAAVATAPTPPGSTPPSPATVAAPTPTQPPATSSAFANPPIATSL